MDDPEGTPAGVDQQLEKSISRITRSVPRLSRRAAGSVLKEARQRKAEGLLSEALAMQIRVQRALSDRYGVDDPFAVGALAQVGTTLFDLERWRTALDVYNQLERSYRQLNGPDDPRVIKVQVWKGLILGHLDQEEDAYDILVTAVTTAQEVLGEDSDELANYLTILARAQVRGGDRAQAEESIRQCLDIRSRILGGDDPLTIASLRDLARLLYEDGSVDEAKVLASSLLVRTTERFGLDHQKTQLARELLEQIERTP